MKSGTGPADGILPGPVYETGWYRKVNEFHLKGGVFSGIIFLAGYHPGYLGAGSYRGNGVYIRDPVPVLP
jgi:hypothetical protein